MKNKKHYRTIVISDLHLGTKGCCAAQLEDFLDHHESDFLYLNGDIIDGWALRRRWRWKSTYNSVIRKIIKRSERGTQVVYVLGNHDDFLRSWLSPHLSFGNISICNEAVHMSADGYSYLVTHGDLFDGVSRMAPWLSWAGARGYDLLLTLNYAYNQVRRRLGLGYWSFSAWAKRNVKRAVDHVFRFEHNLADYCRTRGFGGVICGHIHTAEIKKINGVRYLNSGDWVESLTALVEQDDGEWQIVQWK
jgi:UDP-2,3-diacylglucosamine pyrophosphatase LpxH